MSDARSAAPLGLAGTLVTAVATLAAVLALADPPQPANRELANRIPEAAPYVTEEAALIAPPFEEQWQNTNHPGQCHNCHALAGVGGQRGPTLDRIAVALTEDQLIRQVIQGGGNMPAYGKNLSPAETTALVAFLQTLHPAEQAPAREAYRAAGARP